MHYFCYLFIPLMLHFCHGAKPKHQYVSYKSSNITNVNNTILFCNEPFNGTLFQLANNGKDTLVSEQFANGLLDGISKKWYPNSQLMEQRTYKLGRKQGIQTAFWYNGNKRFEFTAENDAYEGELKEWSEDGKLFHVAHYVNGQEAGVQKMWYTNGTIRANYVIVKGKRYGLLGTKNCKNVSDSIFSVK